MKIEEIVKRIEKINKLNKELGFEEKTMKFIPEYGESIAFKTLKELKKELNKTYIDSYINFAFNANLNGSKGEWNYKIKSDDINKEEISLIIY